MIIYDLDLGWFGTFIFLFIVLLFGFSFPVMLVRSIIRVFKEQKLNRELVRSQQEWDAFWAEHNQEMEEIDASFKEIHESIDRIKAHEQRVHDLSAAIEAASSEEERIAARERLLAELRSFRY